MTLRIAIQSDAVVHANGKQQSFSRRWLELARDQGVEAVLVDVFAHDITEKVAACDAFMWRYMPSAHPRLYAKRLLMAIEEGLRIPVFPSVKTSWHFEDKVAQHYLLALAELPTPLTHVFWSRESAEEFCDRTSYPFVLKLAAGYQSTNVTLVRTRTDAQYYIEELFGHGMVALGYGPASRRHRILRRLRVVAEILRGRNPNSPTSEAELHFGYFFAQEFLPKNEFDTRVTIIGNRAFAFRRFNRPDDFRASGSGRIDWSPSEIGEQSIRLAYKVAQELRAQTVGVDILHRGQQPVIVELTFAYASWAVAACPGHWILSGSPDSGRLDWVLGAMRPEDAIFTDFVAETRVHVDKKVGCHQAREVRL